jgi:hypothetical protein
VKASPVGRDPPARVLVGVAEHGARVGGVRLHVGEIGREGVLLVDPALRLAGVEHPVGLPGLVVHRVELRHRHLERLRFRFRLRVRLGRLSAGLRTRLGTRLRRGRGVQEFDGVGQAHEGTDILVVVAGQRDVVGVDLLGLLHLHAPVLRRLNPTRDEVPGVTEGQFTPRFRHVHALGRTVHDAGRQPLPRESRGLR